MSHLVFLGPDGSEVLKKADFEADSASLAVRNSLGRGTVCLLENRPKNFRECSHVKFLLKSFGLWLDFRFDQCVADCSGHRVRWTRLMTNLLACHGAISKYIF